MQLNLLALKMKYCSGAFYHHSHPNRIFHVGGGHPSHDGGPPPSSSRFGCVEIMEETTALKWKNSAYNAKAKRRKSQFGGFSGTFYPYG